MSRRPSKPNVILDWFNVSYRTAGLVAGGVVLAALLGWLGYRLIFAGPGPRAEAQEAISRATARLAEAMALSGDERIEEIRGSAKAALQEARDAFAADRLDGARVAAIRSENLSQQAIDMAKGQLPGAQEVRFYRIEGDVRVKRAGEFAWEAADRKMVLRLGDQVKTSSSASVQLIYFDGTLTTIQPGSLLEIRDLYEDPATKVRRVSEKLNWGEVMASTQKRNVEGSVHEVATENVAARLAGSTELRVAYDKEKKTSTWDVFEGKVEVAGSGRKEVMEQGERIEAGASGALETKGVLPDVPRLLNPSDQKVFVFEDPSKATATLSWEPVRGSAQYHLSISEKVLFTNLLYDADRRDSTVVIEGIAPGSYYWKVAAVFASGVRGPFSDPRRFRVTSQRIRDREDTVPPKLEITDFVQTGSMLILNGKTEPGASLWIDEEKVDVYEDGTFYSVVRLRKEGVNELHLVAQDPAGNETRLTRRAYVEAY